MAEKENRRKCFKCGASPAEDDVKLYRFSKPGTRNLLRCELWAKYMFPEGDYSSIQFQRKLYNEHRVLCERHFKPEDISNDSRKRLAHNAVPCDDDDERSPPPTPDAPPYSPITSPEGSDRARSRSPIWHQPSESAPRVIAIFSEDGTPFEAEHIEEREEDTTFLATDAHTIFVSPRERGRSGRRSRRRGGRRGDR
ncbi:unnamed protein product [Colias eurytheme]|nr:unnamed protein product [Colias eurytheme]